MKIVNYGICVYLILTITQNVLPTTIIAQLFSMFVCLQVNIYRVYKYELPDYAEFEPGSEDGGRRSGFTLPD